jgi:coenzyme F420-reducing hydrogenase delta subunit
VNACRITVGITKASLRIDELTNDAERLQLENERLREILESRENQINELVEEGNRLREQLQRAIKVECDHPLVQPAQRVNFLSRRERLQRLAS